MAKHLKYVYISKLKKSNYLTLAKLMFSLLSLKSIKIMKGYRSSKSSFKLHKIGFNWWIKWI